MVRRGRQYLRQLSASGKDGDSHFPRLMGGEMRSVVGWSRIFADSECVCVLNTDAEQQLTVWATVDHGINPAGNAMTCLLSTDAAQEGEPVVAEGLNGSAGRITVPPAGFAV